MYFNKTQNKYWFASFNIAKSNLKYIGYVNNYDKNRYLEKIWKAAVYMGSV